MKRFTETDKWSDKWFRKLPPLHKLGWQYLCENCDQAGVITLDRELANFQIGADVPWDDFIDSCGGRIDHLGDGKLWILQFIPFQYGTLSRECKPHAPVFKRLEKHGLTERYCKGIAKGFQTLKEKEKETDRKKNKGGSGGVLVEDVAIPAALDTPEVRAALGEWLAYKTKTGSPYKHASYVARKVAEFEAGGPQAFVAAVNSSIGNSYKGLFPAKGNDGNSKPERKSFRY